MTTTTKSPFHQVLEAVPAADRDWVTLEAHRCMNCTGGRPSDAARSTVAAYERGSLTYERFLADRAK